MRFFYALHLVHEGMGLIIGYLSLVSLHFFHPITLAYVTSRVLRPPWGHEIRCYLWQPLLRLVFWIWLIYRRRSISSSMRCFFDAWRWSSVGCRRLLHFYGWYLMLYGFSFYCASTIILGHIPLSFGWDEPLVEHFLWASAFSLIRDP